MKLRDTKQAWAVKWISDCALDGHREFFLGSGYMPGAPCPAPTVLLFLSRRRARDFVKERFGYIKNRPDLRAEPHGWKMPKVVRVNVTVSEPKS